MGLLTAAWKLVAADGDAGCIFARIHHELRYRGEIKGETFIIELGMPVQHGPGKAHQQLLQTVQTGFGVGLCQLQPRLHVFVEILQ